MNATQETTDRPQYPEQDREVPFSESTADRFISIVKRIKELDSCDELLGEVLATLSIERNRKQMLDAPAESLPLFFEIADKWVARRKAIAHKS